MGFDSSFFLFLIRATWLANPIQAVATFIMIFGAHDNKLFVNEVKIRVLNKWSYMSLSQLC